MIYQKIGTEFTERLASDPASLPVVLFLYWYYLPYMLAGDSEVDKWMNAVSLNGARWSNLCKPQGA